MHSNHGTEDRRIQRKRKSYTNSFKLELIKQAESFGNRQTSKESGVEESNIREWRKRKAELQKLPSKRKTRRCGTQPRWTLLENSLSTWYIDRKDRNCILTTNMIKEKGIQLARELGCTDFTGSNGWVTRFMSRLKLKLQESRGNIGTISKNTVNLQPDLNEASNFRAFFKHRRLAHEIRRRNGIICLDAVPLELEMLEEKIQFTVVLSVSAAGSKLSPLVIFNQRLEETRTSHLHHQEHEEGGILIRFNDSSLITPSLIQDWSDNCWKKWAQSVERSDSDNILILDSLPDQFTGTNFKLKFIPVGMRDLMHPLELAVNTRFKQGITQLWEKWRADKTNQRCDDVGNYDKICNWILKAWSDIQANDVMNGFVQAGIESKVLVDEII